MKTTAEVYQDAILERIAPEHKNLFNWDYWTFQQDSAPDYMVKASQEWLKENVPDFKEKKIDLLAVWIKSIRL